MEQVDVDERWRRSSHASDVYGQDTFMSVLSRVGSLRHPLKIEMGLEGGFGEFVERRVCRASWGMNQSDALQVPPIRLLERIIPVLKEFNRATLNGRRDGVGGRHQIVRG